MTGWLLVLALASAGPASAQVIERHLPPVPSSAPPQLGERTQPAETDDRPFGSRLIGIVLLGPGEAVPMAPVQGVEIGNLAPLRRVALIRALVPLLGQPLSRRLIAEVRVVVSRRYRRAGYPFVSVTTPEQELTGGTLTLRVVEFKAGRLRVRSTRAGAVDRVAGRIRFPADGRIDARALQQDLAWLDRNPFRRTGAVFSAGAELATTDMTITVVPTRPWQAFAGVSSSDSPSTGNVRFYAGALAGGLLGTDSILSAQATTSGFGDPSYLGVGVRVVEPLGVRRELSLLVGYVRSDASAAPFSSLAHTVEGSLDLRFALPPRLAGDGHLGIEAGYQRIEARFGGEPIFRVDASTLALFARYTATVSLHGGTLSTDVALHASPGGIGSNNRADRLFYGQERSGSATYTYLTAEGTLDHMIASRLGWQTQLIIQVSPNPLPGLDQIGLGGSSYVRGYTLDDGGYDTGVVARNTLTLAADQLSRLAAYAFTDWGYGVVVDTPRHSTFGSIGVGFSRALGWGVRVRAEVALPLLDGPRTTAIHPRAFARAEFAL
ncbi:ShlB/FhaC/HecB family hemolysin secretion/activation protein [Sphingomonas bacterium]|uniref:ShlB/FhaC/HecB family hemolysin secretion/activation protein n=1 Tax=Sphingomonas bacterium TaxID=1895847 RepID=UPI0015754275|nr:ShlB/FhaC/HecB family hemolysin secretion/activation protein [Sphingomonas bacterium]